MVYEFQLVVTDADGFRIQHPVLCRGSQIVDKALGVLAALQALRVEVWLGDDQLYSFGETHPSADYALAA
jgi:hypothetical protein